MSALVIILLHQRGACVTETFSHDKRRSFSCIVDTKGRAEGEVHSRKALGKTHTHPPLTYPGQAFLGLGQQNLVEHKLPPLFHLGLL